MERYLCCVTLCLLSLGLMHSKAFEVRIQDASNKTCIYANMLVNFTIHYETNQSTWAMVTLGAPQDKVNTEGSTCGENGQAPLLKVAFGNYSWSLNFTTNNTIYNGDKLIFTYNTDDTVLFPNAQNKGNLSATTSFPDLIPIPLNATYRCLHEESVVVENVTQVYWNVTLQAYAQNATVSEEVSCYADNPTTQTPTTRQVTTPNTTIPAPTTKPVDKPLTGNYSLSNENGTCLLASMGLQLNASMPVDGKTIWTVIDLHPNSTASSGNCGNKSAQLTLNDSNRTIAEFFFFIKNKNFQLQGINVTLMNGSAVSFQRANHNLSFWEASLGNSYLCHKEQLITVSEDLFLNTFDVRVQPFNVNNDTYGTASECSLDDDSILIPIVVGAALAGLIVIVVIAYLIGRRKSYAGYQTL